MPTVITHGVVAGLAGKTLIKRKMPAWFWIFTMIVSIVPDLDVIGFGLGIRYGDFFGHRGFFHSIFFALILGVLVAFILRSIKPKISLPMWKMVLFFFMVGASHGILDAFTNGGLGIALLSPFDNTRYFFSWTPIMVSPLSMKNILSNWGLRVLIYEILYLWVPMILLCFISYLASKIGKRFKTNPV